VSAASTKTAVSERGIGEDSVPEHRIGAVVVAFRSDPAALAELLGLLAPQVRPLVVVDNSDDPDSRARVAAAVRAAGATLVPMDRNAGVAAAQNAGIATAREAGCESVLLSDDDSLPPPDLVARLHEAMDRALASGRRVAAVGPVARDSRAHGAPLVFVDTAFGPRRAPGLEAGAGDGDRTAEGRTSEGRTSEGRTSEGRTSEGRTGEGPAARGPAGGGRAGRGVEPISAAFLLASCCLIRMQAITDVGPMREDLFIDHVDLEWGLRARRAGWELLVVPRLEIRHRLGERVLHPRLLGGRRVHVHAPLRNYYLVRNTLLLAGSGLMPPLWRAGYLWWIAKYALFNVAFVAPRGQRLRMVVRAVRDGLRGRGGPAPFRP